MVLIIQFSISAEIFSKPAYCEEALIRCNKACQSYGWPMSSVCQTGCGIGYLYCGTAQ